MKKRIKRGLIALSILTGAMGLYIHVFMNGLNLTKVDDYLYSVECGHLSMETADRLMSFVDADVEVSCSAVRKDNFHARNFDWYYSEEAEFVVHCGGHGEKYSSIGVAAVSGIQNDKAERGIYSPAYHMLSLYTVDGINEAGVAINTNIVPVGDVKPTVGTNPGGMRLCSAIIPRYILDNAGSVKEALELLWAADIYSYVDSSGPFEVHFMISDSDETVIVEFVDNEMKVVQDEYIMTNFYQSLPELTDHAMGLERFEILRAGYDSVNSKESMLELLKSVWYSKAYTATDPIWISEDYGVLKNEKGEILDIHSDLSDFSDAMEKEAERFRTRTRNGETWCTTHTSLFDLNACTLTVIPQENGKEHSFSLR